MLNGQLWNFAKVRFQLKSGYCGRGQADNSLLCSEYEIATHWAPQNWCKSCMRPTTYHCRFKLSTRLQKTNLIYFNLWASLPFLCLIKILVTWVTIRILAFLKPELILCSFTPLQYLHYSQFEYNNILKYLFKMNLWPQIEVTYATIAPIWIINVTFQQPITLIAVISLSSHLSSLLASRYPNSPITIKIFEPLLKIKP